MILESTTDGMMIENFLRSRLSPEAFGEALRLIRYYALGEANQSVKDFAYNQYLNARHEREYTPELYAWHWSRRY